MKNTILFTPSNEQLLEIANSAPELHSKIKDKVLTQLTDGSSKFIQSKLRGQAEKTYSELYKKLEKEFFTPGDYWKSVPAKLNPMMEEKFSKDISQLLEKTLDSEFKEIIQSNEFKILLRNKIKEQLLALVINNLDEQIKQEAKKITG